jgi:aryl-alcohol dehydrogenase-like predicted oxidoreductase
MPHVTLGLWPIAGITTVGVTAADALDTVRAAMDSGITSFDTAFSYGYEGESDRLLGRLIRHQRDRFTVIGKVGQRWTSDQRRIVDGRAETLVSDAEASLRRIGIERFDVLMLHSPDPQVELERSAEAIAGLQRRGLCTRIGVSNVDAGQFDRFGSVAGCDAIECPLNVIQRDSLDPLIPHCSRAGSEVHVFWVLMKGLLAGRISRDHQFAAGDVRPSYPIYQGQARRRAHEVLDGLQQLASDSACTVAQLSIGWALSQRGVTSALVGARRPEQAHEIAAAKPLPPDTVKAIDALVRDCAAARE